MEAHLSAVLGVSCHYHDAAAALVVDGRILGALQEERLSRVKHDPSVPLRAARALLTQAGLTPGDLDRVVYYEDPYAKLERVLVHGLRVFPRSLSVLPRSLMAQLGQKLWVLDDLARGLGVPRDKVSFVPHHRSHAASAFFTCPWPEAAVLTVDGVGEWTTTGLWRGRERELTEIASLSWPHSLGLLYAGITAWLGFEVNEGEYKVMGLAAFGKPRQRERIEQLITRHGDGSFELVPAPFAWFADPERAFGPAMEALLGPARPPGAPWDLSTEADQLCADVAASLQQVVEEALLALSRRVQAMTGSRYLCLAGGVALNAVANARLAREAGFVGVYVHPAAGDAGGALGAALLGAIELGDALQSGFQPFLGLPADVARAQAVASHLGLKVERVSDPARAIAARLQAGQVVAVCDGRCEWGPRALGNRSLLARADRLSSKERLNAVVKRREPFRPFAPAVSAAECSRWFGGPPDALTPYMTTVRTVSAPDQWPAVTHVDGTARVQTVEPGAPTLLARVLEHEPVVLNTSLNAAGEPICGSAVDAVSFFVKHPADALFVHDLAITRPGGTR